MYIQGEIAPIGGLGYVTVKPYPWPLEVNLNWANWEIDLDFMWTLDIRQDWPIPFPALDTDAFTYRGYSLEWPIPFPEMPTFTTAVVSLPDIPLEWPIPFPIITAPYATAWPIPFPVISVLPSALSTSAWCYNIVYDTGAEATRFTNFAFTRLIRVGGKIYGIKSDGLYLIEGDVDVATEIDSTLVLAPNIYESSHKKWVGWVAGSFDAEAHIYPIINGVEYGPYPTRHTHNQSRKAKMPKGLKDPLWSFKITNDDGEKLRLTWLEIDFYIKSRRAG